MPTPVGIELLGLNPAIWKGKVMFTTVVDNAVERYRFANGVEVAFSYDECAENPLLECDGMECGIIRMEQDALPHDPYGYLERWESMDETEREESGLHAFEFVQDELWGHPEFRVVVSESDIRKAGLDPTMSRNIEKFAEDCVDAYSRWAEGKVYFVGVEVDGEQPEYMGGVYEDPSEAQARWMAKYDFGIDLEGVELM